jgi:hypothetical protein
LECRLTTSSAHNLFRPAFVGSNTRKRQQTQNKGETKKSVETKVLACLGAAALLTAAAFADYTWWTWNPSSGSYVGSPIVSTTWDGDIYFSETGALVASYLVPHQKYPN